MRHENPLDIFPYGDPPTLPTGKFRQIDPPPPLENPILSMGGYGYFLEPQIAVSRPCVACRNFTLTGPQYASMLLLLLYSKGKNIWA